MSNWDYATTVPTETWRSATTIPRELQLKHVGNNILIASQPVKELNKIQAKSKLVDNIKAAKNLDLASVAGKITFPCRININLEQANDFSFRLSNRMGDELLIGFDKKNTQYYIDRSRSGKTDFNKDFAARHVAPRFVKGKMNVSLVIDVSSVELFADDGLSVMTEIFFPNKPYDQLHLKSGGGIKKLEYVRMESIWQ